MRELGKTLTTLLAVLIGAGSIFMIVPNTELAVGFFALSFGILAIIWTSMAVSALSRGSTLRRYTLNFLWCLICIVLYSVWNTIGGLLVWSERPNHMLVYPGYVFLSASFLIFAATARHALKMGQEFGFQSQAKRIQKKMNQR